MHVTRMRAGYYAAQVTGIPGTDGTPAIDRYVITHVREGWEVGTWRGNVLVTTVKRYRDAKGYLSGIESDNLRAIGDFTCDVCGDYAQVMHVSAEGDHKRCPECETRVGEIINRPVAKPSVTQVATMAGKAWDAGMVEEMPVVTRGSLFVTREDAGTYVREMTDAAAHFLLFTLTDIDTGESLDAGGWAPDYTDAFPADQREQLESDVVGFIRYAWPYLSADNLAPQQAGRDFIAVSHGIDSGFDLGKHGDALSELARPFGFDPMVSVTDDDSEETRYYC
jgi:hypothetical protein